MRVFIKTDMNGIPETETEFTAWQGFQELGFKPVFYSVEEELNGCRPDDLIVGGVSIITRKMKEYGIRVTEYDYPETLREFMGRKVHRDTLGSILQKPD